MNNIHPVIAQALAPFAPKVKRSEQIKAIDKAFNRLFMCCEHTHDWNRYLDLIDQEEKGHRRFKPAGINCGLAFGQSRKLFAVKEVFERFVPAHTGEKVYTPEAKDYFRIRGSVFAACAIGDSCATEILKEFSEPEMVEWLASVDYVELNKDTRS
jgi:hypothetical protein